MDLNKSLSEFILEEVVPAANKPSNRFALGMLSAAGGVFGFGSFGDDMKDLSADQVAELIRAGFNAQPTLTIRISDFVPAETVAKYPILKLPFIREVLDTPYDIDIEAAEKLIAKLQQ